MPITRTDSTQRGDVTSDADAKFRQPRVDVDRPASSADVRDEAIIIELEVTCRGLFELLQDAAATTHGAAEALGRNQRSSGPVRPGGPKHGGPRVPRPSRRAAYRDWPEDAPAQAAALKTMHFRLKPMQPSRLWAVEWAAAICRHAEDLSD